MKKNKIVRCFAMLLSAILITGTFSVLQVSAGTSESVLDASTIQNDLDEALWNNPTGEVIAKNGAVLFPANSTNEARLITRRSANLNEGLETLVGVKANLQFKKLPKGKKFVVAFGLGNAESMLGEPGNIEIAFEKKGSLTATVTAYTKDGEAERILAETGCGSASGATVDAQISTDKKLKLLVNGKVLCNTTIPEDGEGRVGFLQTGSCQVTISDVEIHLYKYDAPENCNISEDFESGTYNANLLSSQEVHAAWADAPARACIEDYERNKVYMLYNVGATYIGTMHKYSNFEMSFDVPYLTRVQEEDEDGKLVRYKSDAIGVAFGNAGPDFETWGFQSTGDMILFSQDSSISSYKSGHNAKDENYLFFDQNCTKGFSIKVTVIDTIVTVYLKWMDETEFKQVNSYKLGNETPTGYIQIWTTGTGNFAIDNLNIVNKDFKPNLVELEYDSAAIEIPEDYVYQPMDRVYLPVEEEKEFPWYMITAAVATTCVLTLAVTFAVKKVKNKKEKGGVHGE